MDSPGLPLPVARLRRRHHNAKSAREAHDAAYYSLEVSVRLAVAAHVPANLERLRRGTLGEWVAALPDGGWVSGDMALREAHALLTDIGAGRRSMPATVGARAFLDALVAYRNRVLGHGSTRPAGFYEQASGVLRAALDAAWREHLFLGAGERLVHVEQVVIDADGRHLARILDLTGENPLIVDAQGLDAPEHVRPHRCYLRDGATWRELWPLLIYDEEHEALLCFNGFGRRAQFLDYVSGQTLEGARLEQVFPGTEAALAARLAAGAPLPVAEAPRDANRFGDFTVLARLGQGAMGVVCLARQESLGRLVALKMLPPELARDAVALARFRRETEALSRCEHPNVVKIFMAGEENGIPFYAMEWVEGADLAQVASRLPESGSFDRAVSTAVQGVRAAHPDLFAHLPELERTAPATPTGAARWIDLARLFRDAAQGVQHLHDHGIVHRDLKPANLMVTASGHRAVVMDLGLAQLEGTSLNLSRARDQLVGTLRYMPPEQLQRNLLAVDGRADVYALGASLYELLADRPLFDGDTEARLIEQVLREAPTPLVRVAPGVPADLAAIVSTATDKDARLRYASAAALAQDLDNFLNGRPLAVRPPTLAYLLHKWVARNRALATTIAAAFAIVVGGSVAAAVVLQAKNQDLQLLTDLSRVNSLARSVDEVRPIGPASVTSLSDWLAQFDVLRPREQLYRDSLDSLRRHGGWLDPDGDWRFTDPVAQGQNDILQDMLGSLERLQARANQLGSPVEIMQQRLDCSRALAEWSISGPAVKATWVAAIDAIRSSARYHGLVITPQLGLVPLGADPRSGLWEFLHVLSGEPPARDPGTGGLIVTKDTGIVLVLLPGGEAILGGQSTDAKGVHYDPDAQSDESPLLDVKLAPFFISKFEITQAQWLRLTGTNPSHYRADGWGAGMTYSPIVEALGFVPTPTDPVEGVSWNQCDSACRLVGLALPSEAQWEYAARAGHESVWFRGNDRDSMFGAANVSDEEAARLGDGRAQKGSWKCLDAFPYHAPVGSLDPNDFGLYDVCGNVWEWCADRYDVNRDRGHPRLGDALMEYDDVESLPGERADRGGSFLDDPKYSRLSNRSYERMDFVDRSLGFRPARRIDP